MFDQAPANERIRRWLQNCQRPTVTVQDIQMGLAFWGHAGGQLVRTAIDELVRNGHLTAHHEPDTFNISPSLAP